MKAEHRRILLRFERAIRADEMAGARPPEEHKGIANRYASARSAIEDLLDQLDNTVDKSEVF